MWCFQQRRRKETLCHKRNIRNKYDIKGKKVLCLAGAGGLQAPLLSCAGAKVTEIDISNKMLDKDRAIAKRENLSIEIVKGNMCDLSMFKDGYFDMIINRWDFYCNGSKSN